MFLLVVWFLSLRLPPRRPLGPRLIVVIRELDDVDNDSELAASDREVFSAGVRATRKPVGLRVRFGAAGGSSSFLRFDMRGGVKKDTCISRVTGKTKKNA